MNTLFPPDAAQKHYTSEHDVLCSHAQQLDGLWDFAYLGQVPFEDAPHYNGPWEKMLVPSAFDVLEGVPRQRGVAVYRRFCTVPHDAVASLEIGAASLRAQLLIDGVPVAENIHGYLAFHAEVPASAQPRREIRVVVDSRFDPHTRPMHAPYFDFYQHGGILRPVTLHLHPKSARLAHVAVIPTENYQSGEVEIRLQLAPCGSGNVPSGWSVRWRFDDDAWHHSDSYHGLQASFCAKVARPTLWSPDAPFLHALDIELVLPEQAVRHPPVRFGLRRMEARDGRLFLNGRAIRLVGVNRHEWSPDTGSATSLERMHADLRILKKLGANFIRGSHYPQDQRFLTLCDELGFLVWEENLGWGTPPELLANPLFQHHHRESLGHMVRQSINHPCVVFWGFLNECDSRTEQARRVVQESCEVLRSLDPSRLITFATMHPLEDKCLDLVDVIAVNAYPGWYGCEQEENPLGLIEPRLRHIADHFTTPAGLAKPLLLSEIGVEALYGWRDGARDFFSEGYQADYIREVCRCLTEDERWSGLCLWQFCDVRTYGQGRSLMRPRTYNNKGILNEWRLPKAGFDAAQQGFRHILSRPHTYAQRAHPSGSAHTENVHTPPRNPHNT